jgi:hypothetical protein
VRAAVAICVLMSAGLASRAAAQPEDAPEPGSDPKILPPAESSTVSDTPADSAWRLYHLAFAALAGGRHAESKEILEHIARAYPDHPAAQRAVELIERLSRHEPPPLAKAEKRLRHEGEGRDGPPTGLARAELFLVQTVNGIAIGLESCIALECDDARTVGAFLVVGGGAALTLSLVLTQDGIMPGHTSALNAGTVWGAADALFLTAATQGNDTDEALPAALVVGQLAGLGAGEILWRTIRPSAGDVSLASSIGLWSGVLTFFVLGALEFEVSSEAGFGSLLAVTNLGLLGGAWLASEVPMSRAHVLVIDGGGVIGTLLGAGSALVLGGNDLGAAGFFTATTIGMIGGLSLAAYLTRDWEIEDGDLAFGVLPFEGGAALTFGGRW